MKEFMLIFRVPEIDFKNMSPEIMQALAKKWNDWVSNIEAQGKLVAPPKRLSMEGKVLKPGGVITDGPFVEIRERLGGFIIVKADSIDDATTLAHGCPALGNNGSVEIRPFFEQ
jgi:hypothetical protein